RRAAPAGQEPVVSCPAFTVDLAAKRVTTAAGEVRLTPTEWQLLEILVRNPGKLVSPRRPPAAGRGPADIPQANHLRVYLAQLRRKLERDPASPRHLRTEPGMGYRFEP